MQSIRAELCSAFSPEARHAYGNAFGLIIAKYSKRAHRTETEIVADALRSSSTPILQELQLPAVDYKNFSHDLKAMKTPSEAAQYQLEIVNSYERMSMAFGKPR